MVGILYCSEKVFKRWFASLFMNLKFLVLFCFLFFVSSVSALGITPAIKNINFEPLGEVNITFYVLDASENEFYDVVIRGGDLTEYSSINTDTVRGNGAFVLTIRFPEKIEQPGEHAVSVSIKERASESSFIQTIVEVGATIKAFVPYPGIYGDLTLNILDGNVDEKIPVELYVINRGNNPLEIKKVYVDFISSDHTLSKSLNFTPYTIPVFGDRYFRKYLDTSGMKPGNYIGRARVDYSDLTREVNKSFRIGSLFVNITNFTNLIVGKGIQKFHVSVENGWNSPILGIYVDVSINNDLNESRTFRTPSIDLNPWEEKTIESYFDADGMTGGYNVTLNASYGGRNTVVYGILNVKDYSLVIYGVSAAVALVFFIISYFVIRYILRIRKKR